MGAVHSRALLSPATGPTFFLLWQVDEYEVMYRAIGAASSATDGMAMANMGMYGDPMMMDPRMMGGMMMNPNDPNMMAMMNGGMMGGSSSYTYDASSYHSAPLAG